jgi:hypothetical protein
VVKNELAMKKARSMKSEDEEWRKENGMKDVTMKRK